MNLCNDVFVRDSLKTAYIVHAFDSELASLRLLEHIVNLGPAVVFRWRIADGWPVEYVSENVRQFGYAAEDFMSCRITWPAITHPDDVPRLETEIANFFDQNIYRFSQQYRLITASGETRWIQDWNMVLVDPNGALSHIQGIVLDVTAAKRAEQERQKMQEQLQSALTKVVSGFIPICAKCKSIRTEEGDWKRIETYLQAHGGAQFSHGLCPKCYERLYPGLPVDC